MLSRPYCIRRQKASDEETDLMLLDSSRLMTGIRRRCCCAGELAFILGTMGVIAGEKRRNTVAYVSDLSSLRKRLSKPVKRFLDSHLVGSGRYSAKLVSELGSVKD